MTGGADSMAELAAARSMSHGHQLARTAARSPAHVAFRSVEREVTYAELDERVTRLAHWLADRGTGFGDRVAMLMTNRIELVEAYFAASRLGAIAVPINFRLVPEEIAYIASDAGARALLADAGLASVAAEVRSRVPGIEHCLVSGGGGTEAGPGAVDYEEALASSPTDRVDVDVPDSAPTFLMYTSGTTGRPKGAVLSHFNLVVNTLNTMVARAIATDDEVWLSAVPLFHIAGLNGILTHLMVGATTVIQRSDRFDAVEVVDLLEAQGITGCFFVPSQWQAICAVPGIRDRKLKLRRIVWGASVAPPSVLRAMGETFPGVPNFCAFGQTEMSSVTCSLRGEDALRKMGSVGTPVMNVEVRIVDDDMHDVPIGEVGEIVYRGPTVFQGYWNNPEATADAFAGGWFHSGDLCRMDEDGYIYVVDRKKDMIISGGENIYSAEVEAVIDGHRKARVAVIGIPHERWVETPLAVVVPVDPSDPPTEDEIVEWCRPRLASYKKPTSVVVVDELPANVGGKVLKIRLRETYGDGRAGPG